MQRKKTTDPIAVPATVTAVVDPENDAMLLLDPARAEHYRGELARRSIPLLELKLEMVDEMETNLGKAKQGLQERLAQLLPHASSHRIALPPAATAVQGKQRGRGQKGPPEKETASAKGQLGRKGSKRKATKPAKAGRAAGEGKPFKAPQAATAVLRDGAKNQLVYLEIVRLGKAPTEVLVTFAHASEIINPEGEARAVVARRVSVMLPSLAKKRLIENIGTPRQGIWVPLDGQTAKPAKGEKVTTPKGKRDQAPQTSEVPLREGSQQHILYTEIDRHGAEGIANAKLVDFATKDKVINPERETREVIARRISAMLSVLGKKKLIKNIGASRIQGVWASTANLAGSVAKPAASKKQTVQEDQNRPRKGRKSTRKETGAEALPREGTKVRMLLDEVTRCGGKGITQAAAAEFACKNIYSDGASLKVIDTRVAAMFQTLRTTKLVENIDGVWYRKGSKTDDAESGSDEEASPSTRPVQRPARTERLSNQDTLKQAFLNAYLHGKKRGTFADNIRKEVQKREEDERNDTGFEAADKDGIELCREITQFLMTHRHNYACDDKTPPRWWIKEEAPDPFV